MPCAITLLGMVTLPEFRVLLDQLSENLIVVCEATASVTTVRFDISGSVMFPFMVSLMFWPSMVVACRVVEVGLGAGGGVGDGEAVGFGVAAVVDCAYGWLGGTVANGGVGVARDRGLPSEMNNSTLSTAISNGPAPSLHQFSPIPDIKLTGCV